MTDNIESILPRLLAEIRDAVRDVGGQVRHGFNHLGEQMVLANHRLERLEKMDATLERIDTRLERMDDKLERMDDKLERMDDKLERMDDKLDGMTSILGRIDENTRTTQRQLGTLVGVVSSNLADQVADIRRRLTTIEDRLDITPPR